jgi:hypothetical protein
MSAQGATAMKEQRSITGPLAVIAVLFGMTPSLHAASLEATWTEILTCGGPPLDRGGHSAIHDPVMHRMIIFGGWSGSLEQNLNDTWALNLTKNIWTLVPTKGVLPEIRGGHVAVYDSSRHRMVVFGGLHWPSTWYNDTWELDLTKNTWMPVGTVGKPPSARALNCGFYDSKRDRLIVFGGRESGGSWLNDTWELDFSKNNEWREIPTEGPPSPRGLFASAYDEAHDQIIISAGAGGSNDTWALDLNRYIWGPMESPPHWFGWVATAFDDATGRMIVVGGEHGMPPDSMVIVFDVWSNTWPDVNVTGGTPPVRGTQLPSAIFDPVGQRTIMFGGGTVLTTTFNDTWELLLSPRACPGDFNGDGNVGTSDLLELLSNWGPCR